jgi:hypothetical protein
MLESGLPGSAPAVPGRPVIALRNIYKVYRMGQVEVLALRGVSLVVVRNRKIGFVSRVST